MWRHEAINPVRIRLLVIWYLCRPGIWLGERLERHFLVRMLRDGFLREDIEGEDDIESPGHGYGPAAETDRAV